jgi:hypothetical protein
MFGSTSRHAGYRRYYLCPYNAHASTRTMQIYDRREGRFTLDEVGKSIFGGNLCRCGVDSS